MVVNVTVEDIKRAATLRKEGNFAPSGCPIALAASREAGRQMRMGLWTLFTVAEIAEKTAFGEVPKEAVAFRECFDSDFGEYERTLTRYPEGITFEVDMKV